MVKIVTNAVCDLSPERAAEYGIELISEIISFGSDSYLTNIDITPAEIYAKMRQHKELPTGSQPNAAMYMDAFMAACDVCDEVVCLNMTSKMSGSFNTANLAKQLLEEEGFPAKIYICDTLQLCHGLGFLATEAAKLARNGSCAAEIIENLENTKGLIGEYFVMKSLINAKKGGRIGAIRMALADVLGVKPVLMFRDGTVSDVGIAYSDKQALSALISWYGKRAERGRNVVVFHADNIPDAEFVRAGINELDPKANVELGWLGAGIGIYTGEGAVGITFWENP